TIAKTICLALGQRRAGIAAFYAISPNASRRRARSLRCANCAILNESKMSLAIFVVCAVPRPLALKFIDDLALTQQVPLSLTNVTLDVGEVIEKHRPLHAP